MCAFITNIKRLAQISLIGVALIGLPAKSQAVEVLPQANEVIGVEHSKSRLIRLNRPAASVFIANPEIADVQVKSPTLVYLFGKTVGSTTLYAVDAQDRVIANLDVDVTHNLRQLEKAVHDVLPEADIKFSSINGALVMDGVLTSARDANEINQIAKRFSPAKDGIVNRIRINALNQVNLRVRIAEVSREVNKRIGFNWNITGSIAGSFAFGLASANPLAQAVDAVGTVTLGTSDISGVIDAMEDEGLVTILSEPNLTAMSGEEASFLAGGEFPILYPENDRIVFTFKEFGVRLSFKPVVLDDGRINLKVNPEVSSLSESNSVTLGGFVIPALTTRRADTTVELASGQSFAIAGLLQNKTGHNLEKFPGLGDLPILGTLFRSDKFQREESELVIIVTPYLVKPISHAKASLPTDGFSPPHDMERILFGGAYRTADELGEGVTYDAEGRKLIGPAGFALD